MTEFEDTVAALMVPTEHGDVLRKERVQELLDLVEGSERFTTVYHGELPHNTDRLYRIEVDDV